MMINWRSVDQIIDRALDEDIGTGDLTTLATVAPDAVTNAYIYAKEDGVVAGLQVAERVFIRLDNQIKFVAKKTDGDRFSAGDILAEVSGSARAILTGERTALNLIQRMSGIATMTSRLVDKISGCSSVLVDTRKTAPGLRLLDKFAVTAGGGSNHRFGLFDGVLIKDNHIKSAGGIKKAVEKARLTVPHTVKIEVEVETMEALQEALEAGADIIMLDNMSPGKIREAAAAVNGQALLEVSGGITEDNILEYAKAGVDLISVGGITHSVKALDISLDVREIKVR